MTIKHQNKNISAEKQYVITNVQDNPNGILTFTLSNLHSNTTDTLQIDLSKHKLRLTKVTQSELNRLKNSQNETDIKNRESHIYLVQKNTNDEGVYQEFMWVDNDFEIIGSTAINLEPYFLKENVYNGLDYDQNNNTKALSAYQGYLLDQNKINKSDIVTNLTTDNDNKVLSAKQGKLLQDNKLNKNQTSYKGKNVVVDNNSGEITFEDKPTIPEASTTTPLSDSTNGSIGDSNKWAKADHTHPKSNLYAESGHNHDNIYVKPSNIVGLIKNDGTIDTSIYLIESNFKTINGSSIVGSGNISVAANNVGTFADLSTIISNASSGDTIILDKDYKNSGSESSINIDKNLTIIGNGHIIDADGKSRIFNLEGTSSNTVTVSIININFVKGGTASLNGGAIYAPQYNIVNVYNCNFNKCNCKNGAIYISSSNTIINCNFNKNYANEYAGAIYATLSSNTIIGCSFNENYAISGAGAITCSASSVIRDCEFNGNTSGGNGANIYCFNSSGLTIYNCYVSSGLYQTTNKNDVSSDDIVDNLTTNDSTKVLSAKQGKELKDLIGNAITYINQ